MENREKRCFWVPTYSRTFTPLKRTSFDFQWLGFETRGNEGGEDDDVGGDGGSVESEDEGEGDNGGEEGEDDNEGDNGDEDDNEGDNEGDNGDNEGDNVGEDDNEGGDDNRDEDGEGSDAVDGKRVGDEVVGATVGSNTFRIWITGRLSRFLSSSVLSNSFFTFSASNSLLATLTRVNKSEWTFWLCIATVPKRIASAFASLNWTCTDFCLRCNQDMSFHTSDSVYRKMSPDCDCKTQSSWACCKIYFVCFSPIWMWVCCVFNVCEEEKS